MRHVRMLGLCLVAAFTVGAMAAVPAMAKETKQEKQERKVVEQFKNCPYNEPEVELCFAGVTRGGKKGGFFSLGAVTVPLNKPITLQGGEHEDPETGFVYLRPAANGAETLESPELKVPGGIGVINARIQERSKWPAELTALFNEAKKNKETGLNVKIEQAGGNKLFEIPSALNVTNLIFEEGPAFTLPLKVKMSGPFLEKLGGGPCEVGNDTTPIYQYLTTEPSSNGSAGELSILSEGNQVELANSRLGDIGWPVEEGALAQGCGGAYESYVDDAINEVLNIRSSNYRAHGITLLEGNLYEAVATYAKEKLEP